MGGGDDGGRRRATRRNKEGSKMCGAECDRSKSCGLPPSRRSVPLGAACCCCAMPPLHGRAGAPAAAASAAASSWRRCSELPALHMLRLASRCCAALLPRSIAGARAASLPCPMPCLAAPSAQHGKQAAEQQQQSSSRAQQGSGSSSQRQRRQARPTHRRGACRRRARAGCATQRGPCPTTQPPSGGRPWRSRRTPAARGGGRGQVSSGHAAVREAGWREARAWGAARVQPCQPPPRVPAAPLLAPPCAAHKRTWRAFLAMWVCTVCTMSERMGATNTAGRATCGGQQGGASGRSDGRGLRVLRLRQRLPEKARRAAQLLVLRCCRTAL